MCIIDPLFFFLWVREKKREDLIHSKGTLHVETLLTVLLNLVSSN